MSAPTLISKTVGTASRDFSTMASAWASIASDIVTPNDRYEFKIFSDSNFTLMDISS